METGVLSVTCCLRPCPGNYFNTFVDRDNRDLDELTTHGRSGARREETWRLRGVANLGLTRLARPGGLQTCGAHFRRIQLAAQLSAYRCGSYKFTHHMSV